MTERWNWDLTMKIEPMEWDDFLRWSDGAKTMYEKEAKARKAAESR